MTEQDKILENIDFTIRRRFPHIIDQEKVVDAHEYQRLMDSQSCGDCREFQHGNCPGQPYQGMRQIIKLCILPPLLFRAN